jgi:hypothetical protein
VVLGALSAAGVVGVTRADAPNSDAASAEAVPARGGAAKPQAASPGAPRPAAAGAAGSGATKPADRKAGAATAPAAPPPATRQAKELSSEEMMSQLLKPPPQAGNRPLAPLPAVAGGGPDRTSGAGAVAPSAPVVNVLREGTFLVDRTGRLSRSADGSAAEFVFEADGTSLQDPPVVVIPNLKLMQMEDAAQNNTRDVRFRISGMLTEYRGRNHILLEKVVVVPDVLEKF